MRVGKYSKEEYISRTLKLLGITINSQPEIYSFLIEFCKENLIYSVTLNELTDRIKEFFKRNSKYNSVRTDILEISLNLSNNWRNIIQNCFTSEFNEKKGQISEIIFSLIFYNFYNCSYIFNKIDLDNPNLSRPGIDLIGVKFGNSENEDRAYLVEIKGTEDSVYSQIYSIVDWFNNKLENRLYYELEHLKRKYRKEIGMEFYERLKVLSTKILNSWFLEDIKFLNCKSCGCLIHDDEVNESNLATSIKYFSNITYLPKNNLLNLIKIHNFNEFIQEVFLLAINS